MGAYVACCPGPCNSVHPLLGTLQDSCQQWRRLRRGDSCLKWEGAWKKVKRPRRSGPSQTLLGSFPTDCCCGWGRAHSRLGLGGCSVWHATTIHEATWGMERGTQDASATQHSREDKMTIHTHRSLYTSTHIEVYRLHRDNHAGM